MSAKGPAASRTLGHAQDVYAALKAAGLPDAAVRMVAAQSAFETAGWSGLWDWNLGNITQPIASQAVYQPGNDLPFAKYVDIAAGARALVELLTRSYPDAIPAAVANDLHRYVLALKAGGYAGNANYDAYEAGMARYMGSLP